MDNKKYYQEINIARSITVLCVLFGHSFPDSQTGMSLPAAQWLHDAMYSFHMGCFFLLAGFVSGRKLCECKVNFALETGKKIKRLIVPYLFYSIITMGLKQVFSAFANNKFEITEMWMIFVGKNPNGGMWYLWALFIVSIIFLLINQISRKVTVFILAGAAMYASYLLMPFNVMDSVFGYAIYYVIGILLQKNYENIKTYFDSSLGIFSSVLSGFIFIILLTFTHSPYLITCLLASFSILVMSSLLAKKTCSKAFLVLNELGKYSYDIYLISYFVQIPIRIVFYKLIPLPYWIVVEMMFLLGTLVPYAVCKYIIRKIPIANKILLGNWN